MVWTSLDTRENILAKNTVAFPRAGGLKSILKGLLLDNARTSRTGDSTQPLGGGPSNPK